MNQLERKIVIDLLTNLWCVTPESKWGQPMIKEALDFAIKDLKAIERLNTKGGTNE
jgi:hypothetical protein